jgi:hypothetical protein
LAAILYLARVNPLLAALRPRHTFPALAAQPRLAIGLSQVLLTGIASLGIELAATVIGGAAASGFLISIALPALFLAYWALSAWLIDAGAGISGRHGRRRAFLAVSGAAYPPLIAYALLSLLEAAATRWTTNVTLASAIAWVTLPVLAWFLTLTVFAIRAVYGMNPFNAVALALLPYAALTTALIVVLLALSALHALGVV